MVRPAWNSVCGLQGWQGMHVDCGSGAAGSLPSTATGQCFTSLNLSVPICTMGTQILTSQRYVLYQWESSMLFPLIHLISLSFLGTQWTLPGLDGHKMGSNLLLEGPGKSVLSTGNGMS